MRLEEDIQSLTLDDPDYGDASRFYFFCIAFDQLVKEGVRGDIAELGAYKGHTARVLATMARRLKTTAWILDTFEGFNPEDLTGLDETRQVEFGDTSLDAVRALVGDQNVRYVKGYFPESASQMPDDLSFCFVHIDCDLYEPISQALKYFYPRMLPGGYLLIHDYASLGWDGAEQAVDEFFADKLEPVIPLTDGGGSVVIRKARMPGQTKNWLLLKRRSLFTENWASAAQGGLMDLLGSGWSGPEDWGVWGVGEAHIINLIMDEAPTESVIVNVDCATALVGGRQEEQVDVFAGGRLLATWHFTLEQNRAPRSVDIPGSVVEVQKAGFSLLSVEFRARNVAPISEIDPMLTEGRALGLALFGIRRG